MSTESFNLSTSIFNKSQEKHSRRDPHNTPENLLDMHTLHQVPPFSAHNPQPLGENINIQNKLKNLRLQTKQDKIQEREHSDLVYDRRTIPRGLPTGKVSRTQDSFHTTGGIREVETLENLNYCASEDDLNFKYQQEYQNCLNSGYNSYTSFQNHIGAPSTEGGNIGAGEYSPTSGLNKEYRAKKTIFEEAGRLNFTDLMAERENIPPPSSNIVQPANESSINRLNKPGNSIHTIPKRQIATLDLRSKQSSLSPSQTYKSTTCHYLSSQNPMMNSSLQSTGQKRVYISSIDRQPFKERRESLGSYKSRKSRRSRSINLDVDALYDRTLTSSKEGVMMGSKEREYYQQEIARLTKDLNVQRKLTKDMIRMEEEFENSMKLCVKQEGELETLNMLLENETAKNQK